MVLICPLIGRAWLPPECPTSRRLTPKPPLPGIHVPSHASRPRPDDAASNGSWGSGGDSDEDPSGSFDFPALEEQVRSAIQRLNGQVRRWPACGAEAFRCAERSVGETPCERMCGIMGHVLAIGNPPEYDICWVCRVNNNNYFGTRPLLTIIVHCYR